MTAVVPVTGDPEADELLVTDPLALLIGMLLDQQVPMEWAFVARRAARAASAAGSTPPRSPRWTPSELDAVFKGPPALHRFPGSMAKRTQALCRHLVDDYGGDAAAVWTGAADGRGAVPPARGAARASATRRPRSSPPCWPSGSASRPPGWEEATGALLRRRAPVGGRHRLGREPGPGAGLEEEDEGAGQGQVATPRRERGCADRRSRGPSGPLRSSKSGKHRPRWPAIRVPLLRGLSEPDRITRRRGAGRGAGGRASRAAPPPPGIVAQRVPGPVDEPQLPRPVGVGHHPGVERRYRLVLAAVDHEQRTRGASAPHRRRPGCP